MEKGLKLPDWELVTNYEELGRIWLLSRKSDVNVTIVEKDSQYIHCQVDYLAFYCYWTVIYAANDLEERKELWSRLMELGRICSAGTG